MKFLLIGATGDTGREILKQGLAQGHDITALVRHPSKLAVEHRNLRVIAGDVLNLVDVNAAMAGQEAVVCSLGTTVTLKPVTLFSDGTQNLVDSMVYHSVRRIICITGIGAGDSRGHGGFLYDHLIEPTLLRTIYEDKDRQEDILRDSDREWIIVRPAQLTKGEATGKYRVLLDLKGVKVDEIARADVAGFVLEQLTSDEFLHKTPLLTR